MSSSSTSQPKPRSLTPLLILVALFALPTIAAWVFYLNPDLLPAKRDNRGRLVEPQRPMADVELQTSGQDNLRFFDLQPRWTLLMTSPAPCDDRCQSRLLEFQNIQKALAENGERLARLLVLLPGAELESSYFTAPAGGYPGTHVALAGEEFLARLGPLSDTYSGLANSVFIIDPLGNLMMQYAVDAPPKDILKDLEKLMKASKSWVKGAQYGHR